MATQSEAKEAIFDAVAAIAEEAKAYSGQVGAAMLREAAIAYRAAAGGSQPGVLSVAVQS